MIANSQLQSSSLTARVIKHLSEVHPVGFAHLSSDLRVLEWSENFRDCLISPPDNIQGYPIEELIWEFVGAREGLEDVLQQKNERFHIEYATREEGEGGVRYLNFTVISLEAENSPKGLLLIVEDVTEQANLERALYQERNELLLARNQLAEANAQLNKINRLKSLFLSMAAHDLRAPLTVIFGYVELQKSLLTAGNVKEAEKFSVIVMDQIDRMNRLIRDFLDLDQLEQGQFHLSRKPWDLREIVQHIITMMKHTAHRNSIELFEVLPPEEVRVEIDPERMQQVVYNLMSNAIKYTPSGGKVYISVGTRENTAQLEVKDTGTGMTQEAMHKLFQIYYRTSEARESKTEGTGLGLYIVKTIVEAHQGQVNVVSRPGEGSTFSVTLPLYRRTH